MSRSYCKESMWDGRYCLRVSLENAICHTLIALLFLGLVIFSSPNFLSIFLLSILPFFHFFLFFRSKPWVFGKLPNQGIFEKEGLILNKCSQKSRYSELVSRQWINDVGTGSFLGLNGVLWNNSITLASSLADKESCEQASEVSEAQTTDSDDIVTYVSQKCPKPVSTLV